MGRFILCLLSVALAVLVMARALLPEPVQAAMAESVYGYNLLEEEMPPVTETAGSAIIGEMNSYYFSRPATAKNAFTGALTGKNLILICADNWQPEAARSIVLTTFLSGGAALPDVYRPDWYQGMEGREFALLTGIVPTNVDGKSALDWLGQQEVYLPFTLARTLGARGYDCRAFVTETSRCAAYAAMGFENVEAVGTPAKTMVTDTAESCFGKTPFFVFYVWQEGTCESALSALLTELETRSLLEETAVCLVTGSADGQRAQIFLRGGGLGVPVPEAPCSELDVTPTLLNLFGVDYDSRFLSGRDIYAPLSAPDKAEDPLPLVILRGSAYAGWVTDAGRYSLLEGFQPEMGFSNTRLEESYARLVSAMVYERYIFARRVMENNYFHLIFG